MRLRYGYAVGEHVKIPLLRESPASASIATAPGLSDANARRRLVASLTTPISLIKHAAAAERIWFQRFWAGLDRLAFRLTRGRVTPSAW
jgi:hypothetical protein